MVPLEQELVCLQHLFVCRAFPLDQLLDDVDKPLTLLYLLLFRGENVGLR